MTDIGPKLGGIEDESYVSYTDEDEDFFYIVSTNDVQSQEFRTSIAEYIHERQQFSLSLEIRTKEDKDGFIAIVGNNAEHPIQVTAIICGILNLSDRHTYQSLTKTSELADELYEGRATEQFSAAVITVVSTIIDGEPLDIAEVAEKTNLSARSIQSQVRRIIDYMENN